jgi:hypothetical protein
MNAINEFIQTLKNPNATGETSYYPAYAALVTEALSKHSIEGSLTNIVSGSGGGLPDFGLTTKKDTGSSAIDKGVIELKPPKEGLNFSRDEDQIKKYAKTYGSVLYTNIFESQLFVYSSGQLILLEENSNLISVDALISGNNAVKTQFFEHFSENILRFWVSQSSSSRPAHVATILASYAREAYFTCKSLPISRFKHFEDAYSKTIGVTAAKSFGKEFFVSSIIQTIFYAIFSAWYYFNIREEKKTFDWRSSGWYIDLPIVENLFSFLSTKKNLTELGILSPIEKCSSFLTKIDFKTFKKEFEEEDALSYFYEPFLTKYDPQLKEALGVWFTPAPVVDYIVRLCDKLVKERFDKPLGLADPEVVVLDPCVGTGAFLARAHQLVLERFQERGDGDLAYLKALEHCEKNFIGFDILPAPLVVAHMNLSRTTSVQEIRRNSTPQFRLHLTNTLDRTSPAKMPDLPFPELKEEIERTDTIKQSLPIFVCFGNPPYEGFSQSVKSRDVLKSKFQDVKDVPKPVGQGLNDPYVQFFSFGVQKIMQNGQGILSFISNYSWLDGLSHTGMREKLWDCFDEIQIDNLNGDSRRTGKKGPDGKPDPSVFSLSSLRSSITIGTAIATCVKFKDG